MAIYSAWSSDNGAEITLSVGTDVPQFSDGSSQPNCQRLLYQFEAATLEEANAIHALRMGWEPYKPLGESSPCPKCGATFYPEGSGECWHCGRIC
jgi:hypothetical protein